MLCAVETTHWLPNAIFTQLFYNCNIIFELAPCIHIVRVFSPDGFVAESHRIASQTDHSLCSSPCISNDTFLIVHQNVVKCNKTHTHSLDSALISCSSVRLSETASERERKASQSKRRKSVGASWKPYYFCQIDWHRHEMIKCFHFYSSKSM